MVFSQEIEIKPSIELVTADSNFIEFIKPILNEKHPTKSCEFYWYLYESNNEIIFSKAPLESILSYGVLHDNFDGMITIVDGTKIFINISDTSILNKKFKKSDFFIDFDDFDMESVSILFYECVAYKLNVNTKTYKLELVAKRGDH